MVNPAESWGSARRAARSLRRLVRRGRASFCGFRPSFSNRLLHFADYERRVARPLAAIDAAEQTGSPFVIISGHTATGKSCSLLPISDAVEVRGWLVDLHFVASVAANSEGGLTGGVCFDIADRSVHRSRDRKTRSPAIAAAAKWGSALLESGRSRDPKATAGELRTLCSVMASHDAGVLVMLDEAQGLDPDALSEFAAVAQAVFDDGLPIRVICCGIPPLVQRVLPAVSVPTLRDAPTLIVPNLTDSHARECVVETAAASHSSFTDGALDFIVEHAHGASYRMQLMGATSWRCAEKRLGDDAEPVRVTLRDVKQGYHEATKQYRGATSEPLWERDLREIDREVLATCHLLGVTDEQAIVDQTAARCGASKPACAESVGAALRFGVLARDEHGGLVVDGLLMPTTILPADSMDGPDWQDLWERSWNDEREERRFLTRNQLEDSRYWGL